MSSQAIAAAIPPALFQAVCSIFHDAQHHTSTHRKNVHALVRLHKDHSALGEEGERSFFLAFLHCLHHVLNIRKNDELSNRLMRFIVGFLVRLSASSATTTSGQVNNQQATTRFLENALLYALDNVDAKDKYVRARLCQVVVAGVNAVEEVSAEVFQLLQSKMMERLFDKEAMVRVHAVHAMSRLQALEIDFKGFQTVNEIFADLLVNDPEPQVRKAVLLQIDCNLISLPAVISRARDVEPSIRKLFFTQKMTEVEIAKLTVEQRDFVLKSGLTDRDEAVSRACVDMIFSHWLEQTNSNLIEFLTCLDVVSSDGEVAECALKSFFKVIPRLFESFPEVYFDHLTVETAFVLRAYLAFVKDLHDCTNTSQDINDMVPELTKLKQVMMKFYEYLVAMTDDEASKAEVEFILGEIMSVCSMLDSADEMGRRGCCEVTEEILLNMNISDALFEQGCSLLLKFNERTVFTDTLVSMARDFMSVAESTSVDDQTRNMAVLRALALLKFLLNSNVDFAPFYDFLNDLVIPSVNSRFALVQTEGLCLLGLYVLSSKELLAEYQELFIDFLKVSNAETRAMAIQVLFDVCLVYSKNEDLVKITEKITERLIHTLLDPDASVQSLSADGFGKLLLHDRISNPDMLKQVVSGLLMLFYHPMTMENTKMRQSLSFLFHAYSFSTCQRQANVRECVPGVLADLLKSSNVDVFEQTMYLVDPLNLAGNVNNLNALDLNGRFLLGLLYQAIGCINDYTPIANKLIGYAAKVPLHQGPCTLIVKEALFVANLLTKSPRIQGQALKRLCNNLSIVDDPLLLVSALQSEEIISKITTLCPELITPNAASQPTQLPKQRVNKRLTDIENVMDNLNDILDD